MPENEPVPFSLPPFPRSPGNVLSHRATGPGQYFADIPELVLFQRV